MSPDKVMKPQNVSRKGGIKHTSANTKMEGPSRTQLNAFNTGKKK